MPLDFKRSGTTFLHDPSIHADIVQQKKQRRKNTKTIDCQKIC